MVKRWKKRKRAKIQFFLKGRNKLGEEVSAHVCILLLKVYFKGWKLRVQSTRQNWQITPNKISPLTGSSNNLMIICNQIVWFLW